MFDADDAYETLKDQYVEQKKELVDFGRMSLKECKRETFRLK